MSLPGGKCSAAQILLEVMATESKAHICPECGKKISIMAYLTLPGDYTVECPHCKTRLEPAMNNLNRYIPLVIFILIIITGINRRAGITKLLVYVGIMTAIVFIVFLLAGYWFIRLRKVEDEAE